jgi:hypothetical protein
MANTDADNFALMDTPKSADLKSVDEVKEKARMINALDDAFGLTPEQWLEFINASYTEVKAVYVQQLVMGSE